MRLIIAIVIGWVVISCSWPIPQNSAPAFQNKTEKHE